MTVLNSGILASQVKDFTVFDFPFMFANAKEADAVVDGPSARSCTPSWPTRASSAWPTGSWASATSATASAPSTRSRTSKA
jgi:TRAP-type C4-dicarboxylate transport system substrate-binding protein